MTCPVCGKGERGYSKMAQQSTYTVSHLACVMSQREESMLMKARYQEAEAELAALKRFIEFCLDKGMVPTRQAGVIFARAEEGGDHD